MTSLGADGVHAAYKESDKCNSNFVVIGAKMNGQTEQEIVRQPDIEEQTLIVWTTTNSSQPRLFEVVERRLKNNFTSS